MYISATFSLVPYHIPFRYLFLGTYHIPFRYISPGTLSYTFLLHFPWYHAIYLFVTALGCKCIRSLCRYLWYRTVTAAVRVARHSDPSTGPVLSQSDSSVIFVYLLLFAISSIAFCFMLSTFFSKGRCRDVRDFRVQKGAVETTVCCLSSLAHVHGLANMRSKPYHCSTKHHVMLM